MGAMPFTKRSDRWSFTRYDKLASELTPRIVPEVETADEVEAQF